MDWNSDIFLQNFIAAFSGGAVALGIAKFFADAAIEKLKADFATQLETHRTKLKKSEFVFQKQFEAASALVSLKQKILPRPSVPSPDINEAYEFIAQNLGATNVLLNDYLALHGAALPKTERETLTVLMIDAGMHQSEGNDPEPSSASMKVAEKIWSNVREIEERMIELVMGQSDS